ncbi:hypothetical protein [Mucilaginibacter antarcticus]
MVGGDFFVSLESVQSMVGNEIQLSASEFRRSPIITRGASQSGWGNLERIGVGFNVLVEY